MTSSQNLLTSDFAYLADIVAAHARERPEAIAVADEDKRISWAELDSMANRIAARLQREGVGVGSSTAIVGLNSVEQVAVFIATLRVGAIAGLLTNSATGEAMAAMLRDTGAAHLFLDLCGRSA